MEKYELILSHDKWSYYDLVDVLKELYYESVHSKSAVDKKIPAIIDAGIRTKHLTDNVEGIYIPVVTPEPDDVIYEIDYNCTDLDIKQVFEYLKYCDETGLLIAPPVLKQYFMTMNVKKAKPKRKPVNADPEITDKMLTLNKISHENGENAKSKIADYVLSEMQPPCTCLSSHMKRHVIKAAKGIGASYSLTYTTKNGSPKNISDAVLTAIISKVFRENGAEKRIHKTPMSTTRCEKHGKSLVVK